MLKKSLLTLMLVLPMCMAYAGDGGQIDAEKQGKFSVKSDHRSFNPFNASYTLKGNVVAKFPNRNGFVEIRADKAVAYFFSQKIMATGNVELNFNEVFLRCDRTTIYNKQKQAYMYDNVVYKQDNDTIIAPEARYNWRQKLANFVNASRNNGPVQGNIVLEI